jgi:cation diffusion facilitator CzcD-associated flavoprotein CzcO
VTTESAVKDYDAVIVGAGFGGLYMLHRLRQLGLSARIFEAGNGVGGTWFWNRYPGARCDVESLEYSYQFDEQLQQEWEWEERYSPQSQILEYLNHVADRFNLRDGIELNTRVEATHYDEQTDRWTVTTSNGTARARFVIMATGCLSATNVPDFKGIDSFAGNTYHTGQWPEDDVEFAGQTVGIIGTGSSAIQSIPIIAQQAKHLTVFQREAAFSVPAANAPMDKAKEADIKFRYAEFRKHCAQLPTGAILTMNEALATEASPEELEIEFEKRWENGGLMFLGAFSDLLTDVDGNKKAVEFIQGKIRSIVEDPAVSEMLMPDHVVGCKRLCADSGYYETFNRDNVTLVSVKDAPIDEITPAGLLTGGTEYTFDNLILATGFDAMTGALTRINIHGRNGDLLKDSWADGPKTYLGLGTAGYPNMFTIAGPGSPSVLTNMVPSIEQHVNWIADCITWLDSNDYASIEATPQAQDDWVEHVNAIAGTTIYTSCNSWYLGANVPGKARVFMPLFGFPQYVQKCDDVAANGYEGFALA